MLLARFVDTNFRQDFLVWVARVSPGIRSLDLAYWYVDFATNQLRLAEEVFRKVKFPETVDCAQDAIEFAIKAIFEFAGRRYPPIHDLTRTIPNLRRDFPGFAQELSRAAVASSRWLGTARNIPRYGQQTLGVPPRTLYKKTEVRQALSDAQEVYRLLLSIVKQQKLQLPEKVALLDGYVEGPRFREQPCATRPYSNFSAAQWRQAFDAIQLPNGSQKYQVSEITASKISSQYAMIINPFGEAYPESDVELRPVFSKIKDYVWGGGVFVTAGGFAFFYAWDIKRGQAIPISETRTLVPSAITVHPQARQVVIQQFRSMLEFTGTLLWKELGALTTGDTQIHRGDFPMPVRQNRSDRNKVGNLVMVGGSSTVREFRALRDGTRNLVPLLRGTRPDFGNVYPIAAIKYGHGYFLTCGMNIASRVEFDKSVVAADRFLEWFLHR
jgi:HEPN domain-containing protein